MKDVDWIFAVVDAFYAKAKTDVLIGYHFRVIEDFDTHIPRISAFWEIQLLGSTNRTLSEPFDVARIHQMMGIHRGELGRWLLLFRKTLEEQTEAHPEFSHMKELWLERLKFFENVFLRLLSFQ